MQRRKRCAGNGQGHAAPVRGAAQYGGTGSGSRGSKAHRPVRCAGIYRARAPGGFSGTGCCADGAGAAARPLGQEAAACTVLGAALGVVRAFFPVRGGRLLCRICLLSGAVLPVCRATPPGTAMPGCCAGTWCGSLCRCPLHSLCAGASVACGAGDRRALRLPGRVLRPAARAAARAAANCPQITPQRKKNRKKIAKRTCQTGAALLYNSNVSK